MAGLHSNRGTKRASEARAGLGLDPAAPLADLLTTVEEAAAIPVIVLALPEELAGCLWHDGDRRLIHVNGVHGLPRQRFTLAHELGHAWCRHAGELVIDDVPTLSGRTTQPAEIEANAFAAEFLLPRAGAERHVGREPSLDDLVVLAAIYGVSAIVALYRCTRYGLVGDARAERLREEIDAGLHLERHAALAPPEVRDRLAAIADLPYLSPALRGSALAAALGGSASAAQSAHSAGVEERTLVAALDALAGG
jgi:Zn-dependent peptidase ImmA (M78 family)